MNLILLAVMTLFSTSFAHEEHGGQHGGQHQEMKASAPLTGTSILQLGTSWKNQHGENINLKDLQGKNRLVAMIFTRCETACPLIVEDLKGIAAELDSKSSYPIEVSIFSLDSFRETPKSLLDFAAKRKLPSHWTLLTSNAEAVAELAAALGVRYKRLQNGDFIHSNVIYFLNKSGEIAAKKEGLRTPSGDFIKQIRKEK